MNQKWNDILTQLEVMLPSNTIVSSVVSNTEGVTMVVTIPTKIEAAKLLIQLEAIEYFEEVQINNMVENRDETTSAVTQSFTVLCTYPQPEEETAPVEESTTDTATDMDALN